MIETMGMRRKMKRRVTLIGMAVLCVSCSHAQQTPVASPVAAANAASEQAQTESLIKSDAETNMEIQTETKPSKDDEVAPELKALREAMAAGDAPRISDNAQKVIDRYPQSDGAQEALRALCDVSLKRGEPSEAALYLNAALAISADHFDNQMMSARVAHASGDDQTALKALAKAAEINPEAAQPHVERAAILLSYLDTARALQSAEKAIALSQTCDAQLIYADALYADKQYEPAIRHYELASSCELSEAALKNMAKIYEVHVQDAKAACRYYRILTERFPDNAYYKASRDYQCEL